MVRGAGGCRRSAESSLATLGGTVTVSIGGHTGLDPAVIALAMKDCLASYLNVDVALA